MTRLVYTDAAERDLTHISLFIAANNPAAAVRFVERIREHCAHLAQFPELGPPRRDIAAISARWPMDPT